MSLQKMIMNWTAVYVFILISCLILSVYIHFLEEWNALEEYNSRLLKEGINTDTMHTNVEVDLNEQVDLVYTWVNGSDPNFNRQLHEYLASINRKNTDVMELNRFYDLGTIKYSLRSVEKYASWIRHIFVVTNGQFPSWLRRNHPKLTFVTHEEIFANKSHLPTFASPAIESNLHRIAGLSKRFIYMNDNILLTSKLELSDLITIGGKYKVKFMTERPFMCNKLCNVNSVNNGVCEQNCLTESCEFDGDDCIGKKPPPYPGTDGAFMFDSWMGSIMHTYFLLNKWFGPKDRYVAEHGAHLFDRTIINKLNKRFPKEWELTSSHKTRHHLSVQFQFMFIQYLKETGQIDVVSDMRKARKCCNKVKLVVDNRSDESRRKQIEVCSLELKLKKPNYLVLTNSFTMAMSDKRKSIIEADITNFLETLFPEPSSFER
ncbi:N-acetylglucosamine-1-phosphotransferase subunits alpha/beta-like [Mercenaria mercenaria]|uniref:N-acetylglucosamine-1-phosphotransferase subunits alpha/beta-like n=1 Tax=Mercenaria mercenaria TaxID=6596 RepID=UPI00234ED7AF|nr:N-acetylglucosamine-1-phosphotransferase subunits alpha/beta-like [Mercenaria mercenaria]